MPKTILITGCSSGIGLRAAQMLKEKGWQVFATARQQADIERLKSELEIDVFYLDLTNAASIEATANAVLEKTNGKIYGLFNNAGYGQPGAVEDLPTDALRTQFETNFFGWHDLTRRLIPAMRANGKGRIIQNSSIFGFISAPYRGAYAASKYALEALSDAMRIELQGTGIHISLIEPGPIRTNFIQRAINAYQTNIDLENSPNSEIYKARINAMQKGGKNYFKLEPDIVVAKLEHALNSPRPKARYYVTLPTYAMAYAKRILPTKVLDKIITNI